MHRTTLVVINRNLGVLEHLDLLQLARLLGILDRLSDLEIEATWHHSLHMGKHLGLEDTVHQGVGLLWRSYSKREPIVASR